MFKFKMWPVLATGVLVLSVGSYAIADDDDDDDSVDFLYCMQVLTSNAKLGANLDCPGLTGLIIGADDVTIDLNSFTITGTDVFGTSGVLSFGFGFNDVTIENGTISGFQNGVFVDGAENVKLKNLVIRDPSFGGIVVSESGSIEIEGLSLLGPRRDMTSAIAIRLQVVDGFEVDNIDVHGYLKGIRMNCLPFPACRANPATGRPVTDGKVTNSTFSGTQGIQIFNARDVEISGNHITNCTIFVTGRGNSCDGIHVGFSSEIEIENNYVHDNVEDGDDVAHGIVFRDDVTDSEISANHVYDNDGNGIRVAGMNIGSTGNKIKSNITLGNGTDLFHLPASSPNEWEDNSCETKDGADIPPC